MHPASAFPPDPLTSPVLISAAQQGLLVLARILPLALLAPIFGAAPVPRRVRIAAGILLALALTPPLARSGVSILGGGALTLLAAKEAIIGLTLAMFVRVLFAGIAAFGSLVDLSRGAGLVNAFDAGTARQPAPLGTFAVLLGVTLFITAGGFGVVLTALADSFITAPPAEPMPAAFVGRPAAAAMISLTADLFTVAVRLAAPVLILLLLLDVALGFLSRLAPPVQSYFTGLSLKSLLALFMLAAILGVALRSAFSAFMNALAHWVSSPASVAPGL